MMLNPHGAEDCWRNGIMFVKQGGQFIVSHYREKDLEWWRERTCWFNRMIAGTDTMPVSELMVEEFFTIPSIQNNAAFMHELDRVYEFWAARPALEEFLCK